MKNLFVVLFFSSFLMAVIPGVHGDSAVAKRKIFFSGYTWNIKASSGLLGPGPNYFSASEENIRIDGDGRLHLKIRNKNGRWLCSEIICTENLGNGVYLFQLSGDFTQFDENTVAGLFTWDDAAAFYHREIDIEISKWSEPDRKEIFQYVVQPAYEQGHIYSFKLPAHPGKSTHIIRWGKDFLEFYSIPFHLDVGGGAEAAEIIKQTAPVLWRYKGNVPHPGNARIRINLYLFRGKAPVSPGDQELIVDSFQFFRSE